MTCPPDTNITDAQVAHLPPAVPWPGPSLREHAESPGTRPSQLCQALGTANASRSRLARERPAPSRERVLSQSVWPGFTCSGKGLCPPHGRHAVCGPQSVVLRCLHRALPQWHIPHGHDGWQHGTCGCTSSQLRDPGCSSVPGRSQCALGRKVLPQTPRAGRPRRESRCPDTDVAPGAQAATSSAFDNRPRGLHPPANRLPSQVTATTHKGTRNDAFSPGEAAALQVGD